MAVEVKYRIKSKDESKKGTDSAKRNIDKLGQATKAFGMLAKTAIAGISFAIIIRQAKEMISLFAEQEKVELRLIAAARNNPYINGNAVRSLINAASAMQRLSIFGDEAIIQQQAFLTTLGMTEDQINNVLQASIDLASTGIVSLDSAVKNIAKTYAGMTGELGELIPALKELTVEELKAGAAVELINEAYGGMAEAAASGVSGAKDQIKNSFGDLKESIGAILGTLQAESSRQMQPMIENLTAWIKEHQMQIMSFFVNFPDIVRVSFGLAQSIMQKIFTWDFLIDALPTVLSFMREQIFNTFEVIGAFMIAIGTTIFEPLTVGFEWVAFGIKIAWQNTVDFLIHYINLMSIPLELLMNGILTGMNKVIELGQKIGLFRRAEAAELINLAISTPDWMRPPEPIGIQGDTIRAAWVDAFDSVFIFMDKTIVTYSNLFDDTSLWFAEEIAAFKESLSEVINRDLPARFQLATVPLLAALDDNTAALVTIAESGIPIDYYSRGGPGGLPPTINQLAPVSGIPIDYYSQGGPGGLPSVINQLAPTLLEEFATALGPVIGMLVTMVGSLESVVAIAAPLTLVLQGIMQVLEPAINSVLNPVIDAFMNIGRVLGVTLLPLFNILGQSADVVAMAMDLMTIPIKIFGIAIDLVSRPIQFLADIFLWAANVIRVGVHNLGELLAHPVREGQRDMWTAPGFTSDAFTRPLVDFSDIQRAADRARDPNFFDSDYPSGVGATYTQAPTINVDVDIFTDVITGETGGIRELALLINREIEAAALLGIT